jgi:murein DD-endopeptidase MepM/ murein hydrolase activator NlpD
MRAVRILLLLMLLTTPAQAQTPPSLVWPIDCRPGVDCWLVRYMDHDPGPGARDYACGGLTGDGHKGTDIAIRDLGVMAAGAEVRAAAAGVVEALRDGMADVGVDDAGRAAIAGKECGNGIRLDHGGGWSTWYCHLRRGSLRVRKGDRVEAGQPLALVGLSGDTTFPHLHVDVRRDGAAVDPFVGLEPARDCGAGETPLWRSEVMVTLAYRPVLLTNAGFATGEPEWDDVRRGLHHETVLSASSPALVLWVEAYWIAAGDRLRFRVIMPDGTNLLDEIVVTERPNRRGFRFVGRRRPDGQVWPTGSYMGEIILERDGLAPIVLERRVEVR